MVSKPPNVMLVAFAIAIPPFAVSAPVTVAEARVEAPVTPSVVPTVAAPVIVAEARVAVPPAPRIWFTVTFLVVPLAVIRLSSRSTIGMGKVAGLTGLAEMAVKAVIFTSAILVNC